MLRRVWFWIKKVIPHCSIQEWTAKLLSFPFLPDHTPGLVLIQIDALSRPQLHSALKAGRMPFLEKLLQKRGYHLHSFYSGIPSSTPAVQGELFYGVKCIVPSFGFVNKATNDMYNMVSAHDTTLIEKALESKDPGLLLGGSAYSDIFTGGAKKAGFCATSFGFDRIFIPRHPIRFALVLLLHWFLAVRLIVLLIIEFFLALFDLLRGVIAKENFWKEITFIPSRVGICVLLRELVVAGMTIDASRGVPILHCNFLGYDEQAHRRGPSSRFAHWTLKGIDDSVRRITEAAIHSPHRNYSVWIYSDHGQEKSISYPLLYGKQIHEAIQDAFNERVFKAPDQPTLDTGIQFKRIAFLGKRFARLFSYTDCDNSRLIISAVGPIGHLYVRGEIDMALKIEYAKKLTDEVHVPAVIYVGDSGRVFARTTQGTYALPEEGSEILGRDHPFLQETIEDLITHAHHPYVGDLVLLGWRPHAVPITFPIENGAHAGPGKEETHGFVILPPDIHANGETRIFRPESLRKLVHTFFAPRRN